MSDFVAWSLITLLGVILWNVVKLARLAGQSVSIQEDSAAVLQEIQDEIEKVISRLPSK